MAVRLVQQLRCAIILSSIFSILFGFATAAVAAGSAVVLMYHRFGEDAYPSTSITIKQFEAHIEELSKEKYSGMNPTE